MVDAIKRSTSLVKKVYTREHHINERVCSTGQIFDRTYRFKSCPDYKTKMVTTIEITGLGGTINYPKEVIVKALKEAGLQVEVQDAHPTEDAEEMMRLMKERIDSGEIKDWKVNVKATHCFWPG